jgi:hypothetical protein
LHFDRATYGIDDAPKLDQSAVPGALDQAAVMDGVEIVGSMTSLRSARSHASVRSSCAPVSRLNPTTSAARIAAIWRWPCSDATSAPRPMTDSHNIPPQSMELSRSDVQGQVDPAGFILDTDFVARLVKRFC